MVPGPAAPSACSLVSKHLKELPEIPLAPAGTPCNLWCSDRGQDNKELSAAAAPASDAAVSDTARYADLAWLADGLIEDTADEGTLLDDLLRLGLELGNLEEVFGNTEVESSAQLDEKEEVVYDTGWGGSAQDVSLCSGGIEDDVCRAREAGSGDAQELLLDADLQGSNARTNDSTTSPTQSTILLSYYIYYRL